MTGWAEWVYSFYARAAEDNRLSPAHVALYFALLHEAGHTYAIPFYLNRAAVMAKAKIYSSVTMNKSLRALHEYGYIEYRPSYKPGESMVGMVMLDNV